MIIYTNHVSFLPTQDIFLNLITYRTIPFFLDSATQRLVFVVIGILFFWFGLTADTYTYYDKVLG